MPEGALPEGTLRLGHRTLRPGELAVMAVLTGPALAQLRAAVRDGADIVEVAGGSGADVLAALRDSFPDLLIGVSHGPATVAIGTAVLGPPVLVTLPGDDLAGSLATAAVAAWGGARVFRVSQPGWVRATRRALRMVSAIRGDIPPAYAVRGLA